jgi:hypothetical protein
LNNEFFKQRTIVSSRRIEKKQAPIDWDGDDHLAAGLKASKCKDVSEMMKTFHQTSKCKMYIMYIKCQVPKLHDHDRQLLLVVVVE